MTLLSTSQQMKQAIDKTTRQEAKKKAQEDRGLAMQLLRANSPIPKSKQLLLHLKLRLQYWSLSYYRVVLDIALAMVKTGMRLGNYVDRHMQKNYGVSPLSEEIQRLTSSKN